MYTVRDFIKNKQFYINIFLSRNIKNAKEIIDKLIEIKQNILICENNLIKINSKIKNLSNKLKQNIQKNNTEFVKQIKKELLEIKKQKKEKLDNADNFKIKTNKLLSFLPNICDEVAPYGFTEEQNIIIKTINNEKSKNLIKKYYEIADEFNLINNNCQNLYGSNFIIYQNNGAKLMRALRNFCLDYNIKNNYVEIQAPDILTKEIIEKTGKLNNFEDDLFCFDFKNKKFYLSPTSELQLTSLHANQLFNPNIKSMKLTSFSNCFRKEAGAAGVKYHGNLRIHQFQKVEIVRLCNLENEKEEFNEMCEEISNLLNSLGLTFRIVNICCGKLSSCAAYTYDFEVYFPASKKWVEISSLSSCKDYQTKKLLIRYKNNLKLEKKKYLYSLNGSALAIDRLFSAIIENNYFNNQITMPNILRKYLNNAVFTIKK